MNIEPNWKKINENFPKGIHDFEYLMIYNSRTKMAEIIPHHYLANFRSHAKKRREYSHYAILKTLKSPL